MAGVACRGKARYGVAGEEWDGLAWRIRAGAGKAGHGAARRRGARRGWLATAR